MSAGYSVEDPVEPLQYEIPCNVTMDTCRNQLGSDYSHLAWLSLWMSLKAAKDWHSF